MSNKLDHTLVNPKYMSNHFIDVQDNSCMHTPMGITLPQEEVIIPLYLDGTIVCSDTSSPAQKQLEDCPWIVLISQNYWYPLSV